VNGKFYLFIISGFCRDSVVSIATRYCLTIQGFPVPVQTGLEANPPSYTLGTGLFPEAKRQGRNVNHPPPSGTEVEEGVELYFYELPLSAFVAGYKDKFYYPGLELERAVHTA
jgi:hypothetical protein